MENLVDLGNKQKNKDKKIGSILIVFIVVFVVIGIVLIGIDGWDIAYKKVQKENAQNTEKYNSIAKDYLNSGKFKEAVYVYDLKNYDEDDDDLEYLLYEYATVIENVTMKFETGYLNECVDIEDSIESFYKEYTYFKKYYPNMRYLDDIEKDLHEFLIVYYDDYSLDKINYYKENSIW